MDHDRFDALTRSLGVHASRRSLSRAVAGSGLGAILGSAFGALAVDAKQKRHKKKNKRKKPKKPKFNAFGCVSVGKTCKNAEQCCSGICTGKKGNRTCRAHDVGTCDQAAPGICEAGNPLFSVCNGKSDCACFRTTGGSSICGALFNPGLSECAACRRDADCVALGFPPGSSCAPIGGAFLCAGLCETGLACMMPCGSTPRA
jgi:hypothetical protein